MFYYKSSSSIYTFHLFSYNYICITVSPIKKFCSFEYVISESHCSPKNNNNGFAANAFFGPDILSTDS